MKIIVPERNLDNIIKFNSEHPFIKYLLGFLNFIGIPDILGNCYYDSKNFTLTIHITNYPSDFKPIGFWVCWNKYVEKITTFTHPRCVVIYFLGNEIIYEKDYEKFYRWVEEQNIDRTAIEQILEYPPYENNCINNQGTQLSRLLNKCCCWQFTT